MAPVKVRGLVVSTQDVSDYAAAVLQEGEDRVAKWTARWDEATEGVDAAIEAEEPHQVRVWRGKRTRASYRLGMAEDFLKVVKAGFLPMPSLPAVKLSSLEFRDRNNVIPPKALVALAKAKKLNAFREFLLVDGREYTGRKLRNGGRDPVLVGEVDGEMFPIAWWR